MKKRIIEISVIVASIGIVIGFLFVHFNLSKKESNIKNFSIYCDFEQQNENGEFKCDSANLFFSSGETSENVVYKGKSSLYIPEWKVFQNLIVLEHIKPSSNIYVSIKRHSSSSAAIVAQGTDPKVIYYINNEAIKTDENGWQEVILNFTVGDDFNDILKFYIYNNNKETTYIDDINISVTNKPFFPNYKGIEPLLIYVEDGEFNKIKKKRKEALEKGVLITQNDSWVNALVYGDGKMMEAEIRLKGDWLDHLRGIKWSYRIKLKSDSWKGMRVFSIQTPATRGFLNEWLIHKSCKDLDILSTRYDFVPVFINGEPFGLYAYEEHFKKELIESSKRREGPILKFSETDFWAFMNDKKPNGFTFVTSVIEPFGNLDPIEDSTLYNQFIIGANLLDMYRTKSAIASDIFDVKKVAKFIAFVNSRNAFHSLEWHNTRYYYNPVLCRLEPIAFDMFASINAYGPEIPITPMLLQDKDFEITHHIAYLLSDTVFEKEYFAFLNKFIKEKDYKFYKKKYENEYKYLDSLHKLEFIPYYFDTIQFDSVLYRINKYLPTFLDSLNKESYRHRYQKLNEKPFYYFGLIESEKYADRYFKCYRKSQNTLTCKCFLQYNVIILGLGDEKEIKTSLNNKISNLNSGSIKDYDIVVNTTNKNNTYIYFKLEDTDKIFKTEIVNWPAPTTYNPRNDIAKNATDISEYINHNKKEVHFSGNVSFDNHVYTPIGYTVIFEAGTTIDITNNSAFIINSNVISKGTADNPVKIYSSDKTANGFTVLQAEEKSTLNYTYFDNFNTLDYNHWTITGAVTFYESDVEFYNCKFTNNHCEDMLNTIRCDFYIENCYIENTFSDSHDSDFCTGTLNNCTFKNNGNDAIDFSTSDVTINNCKIIGAGDKGISVGENTKAEINNVVITNVNIGIASKDLSHADVNKCQISNATYGFLLLQKKPEFGPASITANNCTLTDVWTKSLIEKKSTLILNGKEIKGKKNKLKALFYE